MPTKHDDLTTQRVLLTGAAGKVAKRLRQPLAALCRELVVTDLLPIGDLASNERYVQCDMTSASSVNELVKGIDAVVHFAAYPRESTWETLIPANILTLTNLWEAAAQEGIRRVVYASTNHVVGFYPVSQTIDIDAAFRCDSRYGVTKAFAEITARFYFEKYGIESLGLRIGRVEDLPVDERMMSTWLHPGDLLQQVLLGLTGTVQADVLYGVSNNSRAWCNNASTADLGYLPAHSADDHLQPQQLEGKTDEKWAFQGGPFATQGYVGDHNRALEYQIPKANNNYPNEV